jgi:Flp pilus assembly protein TadD
VSGSLAVALLAVLAGCGGSEQPPAVSATAVGEAPALVREAGTFALAAAYVRSLSAGRGSGCTS